MSDNKFNLWRRYNSRPFRRFAFVVDFDASSPDGYKILDHDPVVADASYLAQFADHMGQVQYNVTSGGFNGEAYYTCSNDYEPGTLEHYHSAVRTAPNTAVMAEGRA
jgi:hypothetical protein